MNVDPLKTLRDRIDALDEKLQVLLNERADLAKAVAKIKNATFGKENFYRPEREAEVLSKVLTRNQGPLKGEDMVRLFREIMSACLALEQPLRVAYLGPPGTYTHAAALRHFGHAVTTVDYHTIDEVFRDVEAGASHYGVVAIENSSEGAVPTTLDMFLSSPLKIVGEVQMRIQHNLLSKMANLDNLKRVYGHQQALAQCRNWLNGHLPGIECVAVSSNAEAARYIAQGDLKAAAIASREAAVLYGLNILIRNIEDSPGNTTRFVVIGHESVVSSGNDKTSMLLSAPNRPGALYRLLAPFAEHGISMTRIESRPSRRGMWEYVFFIDIEGHVDDPNISKALSLIKAEAAMVKVLGSYPCAIC